MQTSREIHLRKYPEGIPAPDDFELVEVPLPNLDQGDVLVKNFWMSVDPYMRGRLRDRKSYVEPFKPGAVLSGGAIGQVIASESAHFSPGMYVQSSLGWREYFVSDGTGIQAFRPGNMLPQAFLGILGMPGMTAYIGLLTVGEAKSGETVFVSAASGAVGGVVCQIAKIKGCRVVGSAGSDQKVAWLRDEAGIDAAVNYKTCSDLEAVVAEACPDGIDVYYENVGGCHLEAALNLMNTEGRIVVCGMISHYNDIEPAPGPPNLFRLITQRIRMQGFIVSDHYARYPEYQEQMVEWIAEEKVVWHESVLEGIGNAPKALISLFTGDNFGKMLVKLG